MIRLYRASLFRPLLTALALAAAATASPAPAGAQAGAGAAGASCTVDLPQTSPTSCLLALPANDPQQAVRLLVEVRSGGSPVRNASVRLHATSGTVLPDTARTDAAGNVHALWSRAKSTDSATVVLQVQGPPAESGSSSVSSGVAFVRVAPATPPQIGLGRFRMSRAWFEKNALPSGVVLEIFLDSAGTEVPITDDQACAAHRVAFGAFKNTGTVAPDTVAGVVYSVRRLQREGRIDVEKTDSGAVYSVERLQEEGRIDVEKTDSVARGGGDTACLAVANWTLPEGTGPRNLRASIVPGGSAKPAPNHSSVVLETWARALPRIVAGPVLAYYRSYQGVEVGTDTVYRIERTLPDGSKVSFDSTGTGASKPDDVDGGLRADVFIGVSTPLLPKWKALSVTAGFDLTDPADDWYGGVSLLRVIPGYWPESLPIDIHVLGHWGRSPVLQNRADCASGKPCITEPKRRFHGIAGSVTIDAGSLVTDLIKKAFGF